MNCSSATGSSCSPCASAVDAEPVVGRSPDQCCEHLCPTLTARESSSIPGRTTVHGRLPPEAVLGPRFTAGPAVRLDHGSVAALAADARRIAQLWGKTPLKRQRSEKHTA